MGCSSKPLSPPPRPTCPLETVCVSLLDLVVALAKFLLLFTFSLEGTTVRAFFLSQQPSLRAFHQHLFITSFPGRSRPSCALVGSENPFLTWLTHITSSLCSRWVSYCMQSSSTRHPSSSPSDMVSKLTRSHSPPHTPTSQP